MKSKHTLIVMALAIALLAGLIFAWLSSQPNEETDVQTHIYNFLLEKGFDSIQASGILASAKQNSNLDWTANSVPDGECYGLFQWTYIRLENLEHFANSNNMTVEELDTQLLFLIEEVDSESEYYIGEIQYKGYELEEFWEAQTPSQAAMIFNMAYTRPANNSNRVCDLAEEIYQQYN